MTHDDNELQNEDVGGILFIKKDDVRIARINKNIKNTQELLKYLRNGKKVSLVDELIKERRQEAKKKLK